MTRRSVGAIAISLLVVFTLGAGGGVYTAALFSDSKVIAGSLSTVGTFDPIEEQPLDAATANGTGSKPIDVSAGAQANGSVPAPGPPGPGITSSGPSRSGATEPQRRDGRRRSPRIDR